MDQYAIYPSLRGKVVLITGAAEGIGAAAVELFCRQGSQVVFLDIADDSARKLLGQLTSVGGVTTPTFMHCDVTDLDWLQECAQAVLARFGRVDVLVNNAGWAGPGSRVPTSQVTPASFALDVNVNLRHQFFLTQHIAPAMQRQGAGSIINMGSITWRIPATEVPVYTTCKAAVVGMTRTHAREFGRHGVRVNSIMPGSIATQRQIDTVLTDEYKAESLAAQCLKRVLLPVEVARLMLFLASDDSSAITGGSHVCDGGHSRGSASSTSEACLTWQTCAPKEIITSFTITRTKRPPEGGIGRLPLEYMSGGFSSTASLYAIICHFQL